MRLRRTDASTVGTSGFSLQLPLYGLVIVLMMVAFWILSVAGIGPGAVQCLCDNQIHVWADNAQSLDDVMPDVLINRDGELSVGGSLMAWHAEEPVDLREKFSNLFDNFDELHRLVCDGSPLRRSVFFVAMPKTPMKAVLQVFRECREAGIDTLHLVVNTWPDR